MTGITKHPFVEGPVDCLDTGKIY